MTQGVPLRPARLGDLCERLGGTLDATLGGREVERAISPEHSTSTTDLILVAAARFVAAAGSCPAVVLCRPELAGRLATGRRWVHPHAEWVLAELLDDAPAAPSSSVIAPTAQISPGATVLPGARIGASSTVGPGAVIYGGVVIGERVSVGAGAVIGRPGFGWVTGPDGRTRRMPQRGGVSIEDDVEIGALSTVDSGTLAPTRLGAGSKLDAHVHVGHNVQIGRRCLIAAQSGFAGSVVLEDDVLVGGQVGVKDHVRIGAGARLAAKSGVIGDVPPGATVAGFPAVPRMRWLRGMARLLSG